MHIPFKSYAYTSIPGMYLPLLPGIYPNRRNPIYAFQFDFLRAVLQCSRTRSACIGAHNLAFQGAEFSTARDVPTEHTTALAGTCAVTPSLASESLSPHPPQTQQGRGRVLRRLCGVGSGLRSTAYGCDHDGSSDALAPSHATCSGPHARQ